MNLGSYEMFGRSGLVVSPFCLGAMTFGRADWGVAQAEAQEIFNAYTEAGGNFIDTANVYGSGASEALVGKFISERALRDQLVIATKCGFATGGHPNSGGNGAKQVYQSLDASLARLGTDYVDLYWLHCWDTVTPAEEILETMTSLVRSGSIRYWGVSNMPAWFVSKLVTLAATGAGIGPIGLQYEYSLVAREIEGELLPLARDAGLALQPWSPLAGGFLSGKYKQGITGDADGRLAGGNPIGTDRFTEANWTVLETLVSIAEEVGTDPARVALAWCLSRPQVRGVLIGARRPDQLHANLSAHSVQLEESQMSRLNEASAPQLNYPGSRFSNRIRQRAFGGADIHPFP